MTTDPVPLRGVLRREAYGHLPARWQGRTEHELLATWLGSRPVRPLRSIPGRETFAWPDEGPRLVVKRYATDLARDRWYERLRRGSARSPGRREYDNLERLAAEGLPVPRALAWAEGGSGTSLVAMELVSARGDLRAELARGAPPRPWLEPLVRLVSGLHRLGWYHRDLYLEHVLLARDPERLVLLDVGRARRQRAPRRRWFVKDVAALAHSTPACVPARARLRFLARYLDELAVVARPARRRFAAAVERKRARLAAHRPRHVWSPGAVSP